MDQAESFTSAASGTDFANGQEPKPPPKRRHYGPRTCRICLEIVHPTFEDGPGGALGGLIGSEPRPIYKSEDPESGRLISPCKCKGSLRYVHEGCLQEWRYSDPTADRTFFSCPTCGFQYRIERLSWANRLSSSFSQIVLTVFIFLVCVFLLGFVGDPILNLWQDPVGMLADTVANVLDDIEATNEPEDVGPATWLEHFLKGFFSLGLLGFVKVLFAMTPWQWWNLRSSGLLGTSGRRGGTGRARVENISWALVLIGAMTFIYGVWKAVRKFSASALAKVSDRVFDVGTDDDDEGEDGGNPANESRKDA